MNPTSDDWIKSSLSSFPTHQHRYASMERMRQAGQKWRREDPPAALATSPTGRDDPVGEEEGRPEVGALDTHGAQGAVRNGAQGELALALSFEFLDGADLTVEIGEAAPVGAGECERPLRGTDGEGRVVTHTPKHVHLPWDKPTEEVVGNNADFCCHDDPFLLVQPERCSRSCGTRYVVFLIHTRRGLGC